MLCLSFGSGKVHVCMSFALSASWAKSAKQKLAYDNASTNYANMECGLHAIHICARSAVPVTLRAVQKYGRHCTDAKKTRTQRQLDRLKDLTRRDAVEQAKKSKRVEDRKVITEQIEARQRAKLIKLEAREQARPSACFLSCGARDR